MEYKRGTIFLFINNTFSRGFDSWEEVDKFIEEVFEKNFSGWENIKSATNGNYEYKIYVNYKECQSSFVYSVTWTGFKDKNNDYIFFGDELIDKDGIIWHICEMFDNNIYLINYPDGNYKPTKIKLNPNVEKLLVYKIHKSIKQKFH